MAVYVLDSSAFLAGVSLVFEGKLLIPSSVSDELTSGTGRKKIDEAIARGASFAEADPASLEQVVAEAGKKGEASRLSKTDMDVVAIALQTNGIVVSDDYGIQNLCSAMGVVVQTLSERGIKEEWQWKTRCTGCGKWFDDDPKECLICGSPTKQKRVR